MATQTVDSLDWNLVRTFVAVVRNGSLAAAARDLSCAHPTVARHIQLLEESLGLVLFDRTSQGLTLNDAGQRLADAATTMHRSALEFESASDAVRLAPPSVMRITVADLLCDMVPGLLVAGLQGEAAETLAAENLGIELNVTNEQLNLLERDADIAIRMARPTQQDLVARQVGAVPMAAFASPAYLERYGSVSKHNLAQHRFIDGLQQKNFQRAAGAIGWAFDDSQIVFRSDSLSGQRAAMLAGLGIAGLPRHCVAEGSALPVDDDPQSRVALDVWLVARPGLRNNQRYKALFDSLGAQLQGWLAQLNSRLLAA